MYVLIFVHRFGVETADGWRLYFTIVTRAANRVNTLLVSDVMGDGRSRTNYAATCATPLHRRREQNTSPPSAGPHSAGWTSINSKCRRFVIGAAASCCTNFMQI